MRIGKPTRTRLSVVSFLAGFLVHPAATADYFVTGGQNCMPITIPQSNGMEFYRFGILNRSTTGSDLWVNCPLDVDGEETVAGVDETNDHSIRIVIDPGTASDAKTVTCMFRNFHYTSIAASRVATASKTIGQLRTDNGALDLPDVLDWYWGTGTYGYLNNIACFLPYGSGVKVIKYRSI